MCFCTFSYIQYSAIAARAVRQALKEPMKSEAAKREGSAIRIIKWKDGKAISKYFFMVFQVLICNVVQDSLKSSSTFEWT